MILLNAVKNLIVFGADRVKIDVYIQSWLCALFLLESYFIYVHHNSMQTMSSPYFSSWICGAAEKTSQKPECRNWGEEKQEKRER